jgi:hypothetical protein
MVTFGCIDFRANRRPQDDMARKFNFARRDLSKLSEQTAIRQGAEKRYVYIGAEKGLACGAVSTVRRNSPEVSLTAAA